MSKRYSRIIPLAQQRHKIISDIYVYQLQDNTRLILDEALRYPNTASEDGLEYKECDLKHLMINHIRHEKSNYECGLSNIKKIGQKIDHKKYNSSSYFQYKNATLNRISQTYPFLERECEQQKHKIKMIKDKKRSIS